MSIAKAYAAQDKTSPLAPGSLKEETPVRMTWKSISIFAGFVTVTFTRYGMSGVVQFTPWYPDMR